MSQAAPTIQQRHDHIIAESIQRGLEITLTHRLCQTWRVFKSKFLHGSKESGTIVVAEPLARHQDVEEMPPVGATLGVTFRMGHKKCLFSTIRKPDSPEVGPGQMTLQWPDHLQRMQRRVYQRAQPPKDSVVAVQFWAVSASSQENHDKRRVYYGELADVSAGGMRVDAAQAADVSLGDTFECLFVPKPGSPPIILDAILRHREAADRRRALLGFQFVGLETTAEGQGVLVRLARIVNDFQRRRQ